MTCIPVPLGSRSYDIVVEPGLLARAADLALGAAQSGSAPPVTAAAVLTHPHLADRYAAPILRGLERRGVPAHRLTVPAGERHKTLATVGRLYDALAGARVDRRGLLITVGGGVLGDMGGFVAATYLRGIRFVQVPTTLLAQVDASVGGKTGVDLPAGKNLVGAFHQPSAVLIDSDTLATLPARELRSGLAEVVKYGIIRDAALFARLLAAMPALLRRAPDTLAPAIVRSCEIKAEVVAADETEQGLRAILNYGHTVGHALEAVTGYRRYKHGEAIAIGMVSAALVGEELGVTPPQVTAAIGEALRAAKLPTAFPEDVASEPIIEAMGRDKKTLGGRLRFVLARRIGAVEVVEDVPASAVRAAIERQRSPRPEGRGYPKPGR